MEARARGWFFGGHLERPRLPGEGDQTLFNEMIDRSRWKLAGDVSAARRHSREDLQALIDCVDRVDVKRSGGNGLDCVSTQHHVALVRCRNHHTFIPRGQLVGRAKSESSPGR